MRSTCCVDRGGKLGLSGGRGARRFLRQNGERRLEAVREVAGLRDRAADRAFAVIEVGVQLVHQRLDLDGVGAGDPRLAAAADRRERGAQPVERREAAADLGQAEQQAADRADRRASCCGRSDELRCSGRKGCRSRCARARAARASRGPRRTGRESAAIAASRAGPDPVPEAAHGLDGRRPELAPQPRDEDLDRVRVAIERPARRCARSARSARRRGRDGASGRRARGTRGW